VPSASPQGKCAANRALTYSRIRVNSPRIAPGSLAKPAQARVGAVGPRDVTRRLDITDVCGSGTSQRAFTSYGPEETPVQVQTETCVRTGPRRRLRPYDSSHSEGTFVAWVLNTRSPSMPTYLPPGRKKGADWGAEELREVPK
jgi:hypothetical protein